MVSCTYMAIMIHLFFLQLSFANGKSRDYSLDGFDWTRSTLSKLLHSKQASTVERFVEVWKTDIQPHVSHAPHPECGSNTPSTATTAPRGKGTTSRKRNATDASLSQPSSNPPALRPVHIVSDITNSDADLDTTQLDESIEKRFIGMLNCD